MVNSNGGTAAEKVSACESGDCKAWRHNPRSTGGGRRKCALLHHVGVAVMVFVLHMMS